MLRGKEEKYVELPSEMWRSEYPEYGRLRVSLHGTGDAAANWEDAYAEVLTEHGFARGVASPFSFCCKKRGIRVVVNGDDFSSGGPRSQLGWLEKVMDKHFEAKYTVMGESRSLKKSIVMLHTRISWRTSGIMYELDAKHFQKIVEAWNLQQAKTVGSPAVKENEIGVHDENAHGNHFKKFRHSGNRQMNTSVKRKLECTEAPWPG